MITYDLLVGLRVLMMLLKTAKKNFKKTLKIDHVQTLTNRIVLVRIVGNQSLVRPVKTLLLANE